MPSRAVIAMQTKAMKYPLCIYVRRHIKLNQTTSHSVYA